jgi:hypothetical protein
MTHRGKLDGVEGSLYFRSLDLDDDGFIVAPEAQQAVPATKAD